MNFFYKNATAKVSIFLWMFFMKGIIGEISVFLHDYF